MPLTQMAMTQTVLPTLHQNRSLAECHTAQPTGRKPLGQTELLVAILSESRKSLLHKLRGEQCERLCFLLKNENQVSQELCLYSVGLDLDSKDAFKIYLYFKFSSFISSNWIQINLILFVYTFF